MAAPTTHTAAGELAEHVSGAVAGIADAAKAESQDAEAAVEAVLDRYAALEGELEERRAESERLERDESELPGRIYRANLRGDESAERRLKSQYTAALDRLPGVRSRIEVLERELSGYFDRIRAERDGVEAAVEFQARSQLRPAAATAEARRELLRLRADVLESLDDATKALIPDTADSVRLQRELDKQREAAARLVRAEAN